LNVNFVRSPGPIDFPTSLTRTTRRIYNNRSFKDDAQADLLETMRLEDYPMSKVLQLYVHLAVVQSGRIMIRRQICTLKSTLRPILTV
jgi:hypothetical protein